MSKKFEQLKEKLKELFQLDQPDLDFGLYRIMHAKSGEVTQFLERDLLPQVKAAFEQYAPASRAELQRELDDAIAQAKKLGADPEMLPRVVDLRAKLSSDAVDTDALEAEVYDHLHTFFRRYYSDGDFLSNRVYKAGTYAIPYEGAEVTLHWANKDQYYIKSSEYLRDYTFCLRPGEPNPMRVHFRLVDVAEGEHGNVKESAGKERRFRLAATDFATQENGELVLRFTYQPDASRQKERIAEAEAAILALSGPEWVAWAAELGKPQRAGEDGGSLTRIGSHLDRYTKRNTFDFFIHKDLGGFLRRELDFFIKNEVMHLDDVESETAPRVEQYLSKIKVIRKIAGKLITFLAQLEDFQKKLWLKKKFVVETQWLVRLSLVPDALLPDVIASQAQREEWVSLCAIDQIEGDLASPPYSVPLTTEFLKAHPALMVDTKNFAPEFGAKLLGAIGDLAEQTDGILLHGDNWQALTLMRTSFAGAIHCVYIDPPYNAPNSEIAYKNNYKHSSFLTLMSDRLSAAVPLLEARGACVVAIDKHEENGVSRLMHTLFPGYDNVAVVVEHNRRGVQDAHFSFTHEYALFAIPPSRKHLNQTERPEGEWEWSNLRNWGGESLRTDAANCFYAIHVREGQIVGFGDVWSDEGQHPAGANVLRADGVLEVFPIDGEGVERKWRYERGTVEGILKRLRAEQTAEGIVQIKIAKSSDQFKTVWCAPRYNAGDNGTRLIRDLGIGVGAFDYPKSIFTTRDCVFAVSDAGGTTLDFFAGSGTTGHAVINLNREDAGQRKFILVEMGAHFDSVIVPRLKKVTFSPEWKGGRPTRLATSEEVERSPRVIRIVRLESYEDTLNNLELKRSPEQQSLLDAPAATGEGRLREQYMLGYMLAVESRGSQSVLNVQAFSDPTAYRLKVKAPGSDATREVAVDLIETFHWLIGLRVEHLAAPQAFKCEFERDSEERLQVKSGRLVQAADGPFWFRTVEGRTPDGRRTLIIWRKLTSDIEQDNLVLDHWFRKQRRSSTDSEFDLIYVNGTNNLENTRLDDEAWKVRLIEDDFHRRMFDEAGE